MAMQLGHAWLEFGPLQRRDNACKHCGNANGIAEFEAAYTNNN
jgi:hypothetical protein